MVVLVRSEYASNVGAAMRALANMGGERLILIDAQCELDSKARQMAAGAASLLADVVQYKSWDEFYSNEPDGVRIAMTRRGGRKRKVFPFKEKTTELASAANPPAHLFLIFGPEADGLNNEDMAFVNYACHLPVHGEFASLNLAQAVLLASFIVRENFPPAMAVQQVTGQDEPAAQPFYFPDRLIKEWLTAMGFDIHARRSSAYLTLRKLFLQNLPTRHELQVLEAVLQQNIRKLRGDDAGQDSVGFAFEKLADNLGDIAGKEI
ncbi:MAG: TrmH family RNA methyltransferase [Bdellovibrionaceae bacterium]|nr:TrmH family RNA methyltransferase [Pseudobdellovibrionaceae bacterium]